jgi:hypothetical protein
MLACAASEHRLALDAWISKLGEEELHLQIAHRRTGTTVRSGAERHEGQVRPCRLMSLS